MIVKPKDSHRRDFEAYVRWAIHDEWKPDLGALGPFGHYSAREDRTGYTGLEAFTLVESLGWEVLTGDCNQSPLPCRELSWLRMALYGKAGLNRQIKDWAHGIREGCFCVEELRYVNWVEDGEQVEAYPWLPDWVWVATNRQAGQRPGNLGPFAWYGQLCREERLRDRKAK